MSSDAPIITAKIIMLGDPATGKTSIVRRYSEGVFSEDYKITIGTTFIIKKVKLNTREVKLVIWDLGGQPHYGEVRKRYMEGAKLAISVFDVTNRKSYNNLENWINKYKEVVPEGIIVIAGNKIDMIKERKISVQETMRLKDKYGYITLEVSAKTGENITELFRTVAKEIEKAYTRSIF